LITKVWDPIMNETAIVIFPAPERAFDAVKALEASSGSTARCLVVAIKDLNGNLLLKETTREKMGGTIAAAFIGALAGLALGAAATILGAAAGALIGGAADFLNGVDEARLGKNIGRELQPGETALVIDESQKNMADFEALMKSVGGTIMRHPSLGR
jgi:uncharacterized membrane protein